MGSNKIHKALGPKMAQWAHEGPYGTWAQRRPTYQINYGADLLLNTNTCFDWGLRAKYKLKHIIHNGIWFLHYVFHLVSIVVVCMFMICLQ
jgi:hypothetical protein